MATVLARVPTRAALDIREVRPVSARVQAAVVLGLGGGACRLALFSVAPCGLF